MKSVNKREVGHLCYMRPLKDVLPANADKVLYVFYDIETNQYTLLSDKGKAHVPKLVCVQQVCERFENVEGTGDCELSGNRRHSFRDDPLGEQLTYLCEPRPGPRRLSRTRITPKHSTYTLF